MRLSLHSVAPRARFFVWGKGGKCIMRRVRDSRWLTDGAIRPLDHFPPVLPTPHVHAHSLLGLVNFLYGVGQFSGSKWCTDNGKQTSTTLGVLLYMTRMLRLVSMSLTGWEA